MSTTMSATLTLSMMPSKLGKARIARKRRLVKGATGGVLRKRRLIVKRKRKIIGTLGKRRIHPPLTKRRKGIRIRRVRKTLNYGAEYNKGFDQAYNEGFNAGYAQGLGS